MFLADYFRFPFHQYNNSKKGANLLNDISRQDVYLWFANLCLNMFKWSGLPDTCNERALEETLFFNGQALFFDDPALGFKHSPCTAEAGLNFYFEPKKWRAMSYGYNKEYDSDKCVLIRNNERCYATSPVVAIYSSRISDIGRSIDVYCSNLKRPLVYATEDDRKLSIKILQDKKENNEAVIIVDPLLAGAVAQPQPIRIDPKGLSELWTTRQHWIDEFNTRIGANNANTEKKERLLTDEVNSNNQVILLNADTMLDWRQKACEEINAMFGQNISCEFKHDYLREGAQNDAAIGDDLHGGVEPTS